MNGASGGSELCLLIFKKYIYKRKKELLKVPSTDFFFPSFYFIFFRSFFHPPACVCLCVLCARRGVGVLRHGVLGDLHVPGALLGDAEPQLAGLQRLHGEQQPSQGGRGLQLRHLPAAGHAADRQHLQPAVHRRHPGQERYARAPATPKKVPAGRPSVFSWVYFCLFFLFVVLPKKNDSISWNTADFALCLQPLVKTLGFSSVHSRYHILITENQVYSKT